MAYIGLPALPDTVVTDEFYYNNSEISNSPVTVKSGMTTITMHWLFVDNRKNTNSPVWLKMWQAASGSVTAGTTVPMHIVKVKAGSYVLLRIPTGLPCGTDLSVAAITAGGTGGSAGPVNDVTVKIYGTATA